MSYSVEWFGDFPFKKDKKKNKWLVKLFYALFSADYGGIEAYWESS